MKMNEEVFAWVGYIVAATAVTSAIFLGWIWLAIEVERFLNAFAIQ